MGAFSLIVVINLLNRYIDDIPLNPIRELYEICAQHFPGQGVNFIAEDEKQSVETHQNMEEVNNNSPSDHQSFASSPPRKKYVSVTIKGQKFEGKGSNLKNAKRRAANKAIQCFKPLVR